MNEIKRQDLCAVDCIFNRFEYDEDKNDYIHVLICRCDKYLTPLNNIVVYDDEEKSSFLTTIKCDTCKENMYKLV